MALKERTIEDFEKVPNGVDSLFEIRAAKNDNDDFNRSRTVLFVIAVSVSLFLIMLCYLILPTSKVKAVSVTGNNYLDSSYVQNISGISTKSVYYLTFPNKTASAVKADPMVEDASVRMLRNNIVSINVTEKKPVGYRYDDDQPVILFADGTECDLTSDYMALLSRIPYITGFNEEQQTHLLTKALGDLTIDVIDDIAQISQYAMSYDDEVVEVEMRDGGIFFGSFYSLYLLNEYTTISSRRTNKDYCIYGYQNGVYSNRVCPWDEVKVEKEYWTDEDGNYITNKWGDKAVKHYYKDATGYYLDAEGNKILIPIDAYGSDQPDPDFLDHYILGYYDTGVLIIPEEKPEDEENIEQKYEEGDIISEEDLEALSGSQSDTETDDDSGSEEGGSEEPAEEEAQEEPRSGYTSERDPQAG